MTDTLLSCAAFLLFCASAGLGRRLLRLLPGHHRSADTMAFVRSVSGLLVTFTALVLSLLITSVNEDFKKTDTDMRHYASDIIRLDAELAAYGAATTEVRDILRRYTAAVVASTWPEEPRPAGSYPDAPTDGPNLDSPNLGALLQQGEVTLQHLVATSPAETRLQAACLTRLNQLRDLRWTLVNEANSSLSPPFLSMMLFWLVMVFLCFGLIAPGNATAVTFVGLVAVALAGAIFVMLELDGPLDGVVKVSSDAMRHALQHLDNRASPSG